jgi:hypothetical protein
MGVDMTKEAFVVMPFSTTATCSEKKWTETFDYIFKPALEGAGYSCERAKPATGMLLESIIAKLRNSRVVLADVTDRNPNVFYELGVRHALRKGTVIVSRDSEIPSDLGGHWYIRYGTSPAEVQDFKDEIKRIVADIEATPDKNDNAVATYLEREGLAVADYTRRDSLKRLGALSTELSGNLLVLEGLMAHGQARDLLSYGCLDLLCHTLYVDIGPKALALAYELRSKLKRLEAGLEVNAAQAHAQAKELTKAVSAIRERMSRGELEEPSSISMMIWANGGADLVDVAEVAPFFRPEGQPVWPRTLPDSLCVPSQQQLDADKEPGVFDLGALLQPLTCSGLKADLNDLPKASLSQPPAGADGGSKPDTNPEPAQRQKARKLAKRAGTRP